MSLPEDFTSPDDYFAECVKILQEYSYFYSVPNVDILIEDVLNEIDVNVKNIDVFQDDLDLANASDDFLVQFFSKTKIFRITHDDYKDNELEYDINVPLSPKKKHEIIYLAEEIKEMCANAGCEVVVDFGSGLGYLDQHIFETTNLKILGIECNESHYVGAKKRQRKYHENSIDNVKYIKHTITGDSYDKIQGFLIDKFGEGKFCIAGLHACADLTIDAIDLFLKMDNAQAIVIMPCCYHKMVEENGRFKNFPLSKTLKGIFEKCKAENMKIPFLRLAAQPPNVDEKLEDLVFNLLSRAVLQLYAQKHNCKLKRNKRKAVKTKTMRNNFDSYIQDAVTYGFTLTKNGPSNESKNVESPSFDLEELMTLWKSVTPEIFQKTGIYILLQNYLQPIIENFVLYDRLVYLKENGISNCRFKKILNETTSPRCLALVANK